MAGAAFIRPLVLALVLATAACSPGGLDAGPGGGAAGGADGGSGGGGVSVEITGPPVLPHVQAFADAACAAVGSCQALTYEGHDPSADRALDFLVSDEFGSLPTDGNALGDALADFALAGQEPHGIMYVIFRQRYNDGGGWRPMEDRGSITQNHYDHVHVSFYETAP